MPTPSYQDFISNATPEDVQALGHLMYGMQVQTSDPVQAEVIFAQLERLFTYNMISKPKRGWDKVIEGTPPNETEQVWFTFEARVTPTAINYMAKAAMERAVIAQGGTV